jgi:hypothetical protein
MKKLKKKHIPKGYKYAFIDDDGAAWATKVKPEMEFGEWKAKIIIDYYFIGRNFDNSKWKSSIVSKK